MSRCMWLVWCMLFVEGVHSTSCPDAWMTFQGSCYLFGADTSMTFFGAEQYCRQHEGHLVHIETAEENNFLKQFLRRQGNGEHYWIGLTDEMIDGRWEWYGAHTKPNFTDWLPGEPSDRTHKENCAHFFSGYPVDYRWNDVACDRSFEPLCEIRSE